MNKITLDNALQQLRANAEIAGGRPASAEPNSESPGFSVVLKNALDSVNQAQGEAAGLAQAFELDRSGVSLHEVMIAAQKANISFQAAVQVRNKLVSAYHDIMNMQV